MDHTYELLYDIVEGRLQNEGKLMPCSKQAFLFASSMEPGVCDGIQMQDMDNSVFLEAVFVGFLNRLPDEETKKYWMGRVQENPDIFRQSLLDAIIFSQEFVVKGGSFQNNRMVSPQLRESAAFAWVLSGEQENNLSASAQPGLIDHLYKAYMHVPSPIRSKVRKILRRN